MLPTCFLFPKGNPSGAFSWELRLHHSRSFPGRVPLSVGWLQVVHQSSVRDHHSVLWALHGVGHSVQFRIGRCPDPAALALGGWHRLDGLGTNRQTDRYLMFSFSFTAFIWKGSKEVTSFNPGRRLHHFHQILLLKHSIFILVYQVLYSEYSTWSLSQVLASYLLIWLNMCCISFFPFF